MYHVGGSRGPIREHHIPSPLPSADHHIYIHSPSIFMHVSLVLALCPTSIKGTVLSGYCRNPLLYGILAGQSSLGKLGGREIKTSALVSRRSWVRIPPESPVKFFHRHSESTEYIVLYARRCRAKLNQLNLFLIVKCHGNKMVHKCNYC